MPSGAKKRKAAKKKKGKETNTNPSTNNPQRNDELKSHDDKGSDGGEGVSPTHHDHDDDDHPFNEGSEEVEQGNPSAADAKSVKEVPVDIQIHEAVGRKEDVGSVVIERDSTSKENGERKDINSVHTKPAKESDYVDVKDLKDEANNTVKEAVTYDELVKSIDSSHAKMTHITEDAPVEKTGDSVESVKPSGSVSEANGRDTGNALSDDNVRRSSLEEPKPKEFDNHVLPHVSRSPLPESTNGMEYVKDSEAPESSEDQPLVASAPRMAQKTSWLSCCGLFEVLSGSNR